jgi:hypothetical protein
MKTVAQDKLLSKAEHLRRQVAEAEATLGSLKSKLAAVEAKLNGLAAPKTGLEMLWAAALPLARTRSSKYRCRVEWNRIPKHEQPTIKEALEALKAWNRHEEWRKDCNQFVPGLHRFIKERMWESLPESASRPAMRNLSIPKPLVKNHPDEEITDPAEIAKYLSIRVRN